MQIILNAHLALNPSYLNSSIKSRRKNRAIIYYKVFMHVLNKTINKNELISQNKAWFAIKLKDKIKRPYIVAFNFCLTEHSPRLIL